MNRLATPLLGLMLGLGLSAPGAAFADAAIKLKFRDDATWTGVSGYAGNHKTLGATGGYRGLYKVRWWEDGNDPCKLELGTKHLNTFDSNQPYVLLDGVTTALGKQPCSSPGDVRSVILTGNTNWIYKVQVCTTDKSNTSKDKLKGLRVWARTINDRSPLSMTSQASEEEAVHTNCNDWHPAVSCPTGKLASRIRVHHDPLEKFVRGIALECRTPELD